MKTLKKISFLLFVFFTACSLSFAGDVYDYSTLSSEISDTSANINFTSDISLTGSLPYLMSGKTITGNNYSLNAAGFSFLYDNTSSALNLTISDLTIKNASSTDGGAIYLETNTNPAPAAADNRNFSQTNFLNNSATNNGGAMYLNGGVSVFGQSNVFNGNAAGNSGGAIYVTDDSLAAATPSILSFFNGNMSFSGNHSAVSGGAIYLEGSLLDASWAKNTVFDDNSSGDGGAIYASDSRSVFSGEAVFSNNTASGNGGAVLAYNSETDFSMANSSFTNNTAQTGGAVAALDNSLVNFGKAVFSGNAATAYGGAIYIESSTASFTTDNGAVLFTGNTVNGTPNDIYVNDNSTLNFNATSDIIRLEGGIITEASGAGITINKTGSQTLYLGGTNEIWGTFNITAGDIALLSGASFKGASLILPSGSALDMQNNSADTVEVSTFKSPTNLKLDVFENGTNDKITAGSVEVSGNLSIKAGVGTYTNAIFDIVESTQTAVAGTFASSSINSSMLTYQIDYSNPDIIRLIVNGTYLSNFSSLAGATFNQREAAKALDALSAGGTASAALLDVINNTVSLDDSSQKNALSQMSGYFLANVIRSAALDSDNNQIYDRIKNHCPQDNTSSGVWLQLTGGYTKYGGDENSLNEYQYVETGVMGGYDSFIEDSDIMWGIYGKYNNGDISQVPGNSAYTSNAGLGIYGGYIEKSWEIKALFSGIYDSYDTTRYIPFNDVKAKAGFNGMTFGGDVEGALKFEVAENINFRPYLGIEARNSNYSDFTESGAGALDLKVDGGNYFRSAGRIGAGAGYDDKFWSAYVNAEAKCLFSGTAPEIESVFEGTDQSFKSRGYEEDLLIFGIGIGGSVKVYKGLKVFVNGSYYAADKFQNLYGNIGLRYTFCSVKAKLSENKEILKRRIEEQQAAARAEAAEQARQKAAEEEAAREQLAQQQEAERQAAQQRALEEQRMKDEAAQQAARDEEEQRLMAQEQARQAQAEKAEAAKAKAAAAKAAKAEALKQSQAQAEEKARIARENREAKAAKVKADKEAAIAKQQADLAKKQALAEEKAKQAALRKEAEAQRKAKEKADKLAAEQAEAAAKAKAEASKAEATPAPAVTENISEEPAAPEMSEQVSTETVAAEVQSDSSTLTEQNNANRSNGGKKSAKRANNDVPDNTLFNNYHYKLSGLDELQPKAVVANSVYIAAPNGIPYDVYNKTADLAATVAKKLLGISDQK